MSPADWLGQWQEVDPQDGLREVIRRYLRTYGPVTHGDLARWLRVKPAQARARLADLGDELVEVAVVLGEGGRTQRAWVLDEDADGDWETAPLTVRLLPQYDAYIIAAGQRELIQPPGIKPRLSAAELGRFEGATGTRIVLIDGVIAGAWDRIERRAGLTVRVTAFRALPGAERSLLEEQAELIGQYYGANAALEVLPVKDGH